WAARRRARHTPRRGASQAASQWTILNPLLGAIRTERRRARSRLYRRPQLNKLLGREIKKKDALQRTLLPVGQARRNYRKALISPKFPKFEKVPPPGRRVRLFWTKDPVDRNWPPLVWSETPLNRQQGAPLFLKGFSAW